MLILDAVSPLERIRLTAELATKSQAVPDAKAIERVMLAKAIASLIVLLGGKPTELGRESKVKTAKGTKLSTNFALVEAEDLVVSHETDGTPNPAYPQELQPRDRARATSQAWVIKTAKSLDPDSLGRTQRADSGAPIVGSDMVVESGNGRTMAIREAYRIGAADEYREWLIEEADYFGIDAARVASMKSPVLVRIRSTDIDRAAFAVEANQDDKLAMTATETARTDARRLDDAMISKLTGDGDLTAASNRDFLGAFLQSLGDAEAAQYMTSDGKPTAGLIARVQAAIFAKAYNDDRLLEMTADSAKPEIANVIAALNVAAPEFIQAQSMNRVAAEDAATKLADSVEISLNQQAVEAIIGATRALQKAKDSGLGIDEFLKQQDMFGSIDPGVAAMALFIARNNRSPKRLGLAFKAMAEFVRSELERQQTASMFGDSDQATFADIVAAANRRLEQEFGEGAFQIETSGSLFDSVSALERVKLTAELAAKSMAVPSAKALERVKLAKAISELIVKLGGNTAPAKAQISYSLNEKEASANSLVNYASGALKDLPQAIRYFETQTVAMLGQEVGGAGSALASSLMLSGEYRATSVQKAQIDAYKELFSRGLKLNIDWGTSVADFDAASEDMKAGAMSNPEFKQAFDAVSEYARESNQRLSDLSMKRRDAIRANDADKAVEYNNLYKALYANIVEVDKANRARLEEVRGKWKSSIVSRQKEAMGAKGEIILAALLEKSPVSQADAEAWASKQIIDDNAKAKLKKIGYKPDQVIADMAEFYRITGGKSSAIRLSINGSRRANAVGVTAKLGEKVIMVDGDFNKVTLFHELGHFLENDPIAQGASNGFLLSRREDEKAHSLRRLTGNNGYDMREVAYKDKWLNPYIGKVYRDGVTECFSMAVQYLANPQDAAMLAAKDPEMFAYVSGYLTSPLTPAMAAKLTMHETAIGDLVEKRATEEVLFGQALEKLASEVKLQMDGWWNSVKENDPGTRYQVEGAQSKSSATPKYLGSFGEYRVFEGVYRNRMTKRASKGFWVMRVTPSRFSDDAAIHGDLNTAKALIALSIKDGDGLSQTYYNYFHEGKGFKSKKPKVIEVAGLAANGVKA